MTTTSKENNGTLTAFGASMAKTLLAIEAKASESKKSMLLKLASKQLDKARYEIVLDSYQVNLVQLGMSENTAKVRKSEALQVIKAVNLTAVTNDNYNALTAFIGEYNAFIQLARDLQKTNEANKEVKEAKSKPLSEKGAELVSENLAKANASQLHGFISESVAKLQADTPPTMAGLSVLKLVNNIVNTALKNGDIEQYIIEQLTKLEAISNEAIIKVETAQKQANEANKSFANLPEAIL